MNTQGIPTADLSTEQIAAIIAERDSYKATADKYSTDLKNVVEEVKAMRVENRDLKSRTSAPDDTTVGNIDERVKAVLTERDRAAMVGLREKLLNEASQKFETSPEKAEILKEALKKKLSRMNLESITDEAELREAFGDALTLVAGNAPSDTPGASTVYTSPGAAQPYQAAPSDGLSKEERLVAQKMGWDAKKFQYMKAKFPSIIESSLNQI